MQIYSCDLIAYCYRRTNTYIFHRKSILRLIILCLLFFLIKAGRIHKYFRSRVSTKLQSPFEISQTHLGLHKREIILSMRFIFLIAPDLVYFVLHLPDTGGYHTGH